MSDSVTNNHGRPRARVIVRWNDAELEAMFAEFRELCIQSNTELFERHKEVLIELFGPRGKPSYVNPRKRQPGPITRRMRIAQEIEAGIREEIQHEGEQTNMKEQRMRRG